MFENERVEIRWTEAVKLLQIINIQGFDQIIWSPAAPLNNTQQQKPGFAEESGLCLLKIVISFFSMQAFLPASIVVDCIIPMGLGFYSYSINR